MTLVDCAVVFEREPGAQSAKHARTVSIPTHVVVGVAPADVDPDAVGPIL